MRRTALQFIGLLHAFTLTTTQALMKLSLSPQILVECDQQVTLHCNASSSQHGLSIKHMEWSQDSESLCSVDSEGNVTHHWTSQSDFHCEYENGRLSIILERVLPVHSGKQRPYRCKQYSNQGAKSDYTRVELRECSGTAKGVLMSDGPSCIFNQVYPDGDVHWFHGSHNLSHGSVQQNTTKQVDSEGWLTIRSYLDSKSPHGSYNCSLMSTMSGRYIASALVATKAKALGQTILNNNGVGSQKAMTTVLLLSLLLAVVR